MRVVQKVTGVAGVLAMLRYTAIVKVPEGGRKKMHKIADQIVIEAKINTPVDKHNLEEAIHKVVNYEDRGRLGIVIEIADSVNGVDVEAYATQVHENYSSMTPGPATVLKQQANPGHLVGEKFLDRAVEKFQKDIPKAILQAVLVEIPK